MSSPNKLSRPTAMPLWQHKLGSRLGLYIPVAVRLHHLACIELLVRCTCKLGNGDATQSGEFRSSVRF